MDQQTLGMIAILIVGPALMVWTSKATVQPRHAAIYAVLSLFLGAIGAGALAFLQPGQGMFGLLLGAAGVCVAALAICFLSAAVSIVVAIATRGSRPGRTPRRPVSHEPLLKEYREWQRSTHQPNASYHDFLYKANFRRFPASGVSLLIGFVVMIIVFILVLRR